MQHSLHGPPPAIDLDSKTDADLLAMARAHMASVTWHQDQIDLLHTELEQRLPPDSPLLDWSAGSRRHQ